MSDPLPTSSSPRATGVFLITFALLSLPFWFTPFAPLIDLPQHLCQVTLAKQALNGEAPHLVLQWYHPNTLVYVLIAAWMALLPAIAAGHAVALSILAGWVGSVFYLAHQRHRSLASAMVAATLTFNLAWYWGFLNFLVGWPLFVVFIVRLGKPKDPFRGWEFLALSLGLLFAHVLWFLMASLVLGIHFLSARQLTFQQRIARLAWWVPGGIYALVWFLFFSGSVVDHGFMPEPLWKTLPLERIRPTYLAAHTFGGLPPGWIRFLFFTVALWPLIAVFSHARDLTRQVDAHLLRVAAVVGACALCMPSDYMATIRFASRWIAVVFILLLLALPAPRCRPRLRAAFATLLVLTLSAVTSYHWKGFYRDGLPGLADALRQVPASARVIGLDYRPTSKWIQGRPFMHMYAYAQAIHGGILNFSFTSHPSVLVVRKAPIEPPWPGRVDWRVSRLREADFGLFDVAIVHGTEADHQAMSEKPYLKPLNTSGTWRTYRIDRQLVPAYAAEDPSP